MRAQGFTLGGSRTEPSSFEDLLGPAGDRYFGAGYRDVRYSLAAIARAPGAKLALNAIASARYPDRWSVGADGTHLTPHLSSVDAIVLPLMALEALKNEADREQLSSLFVESIELRAGRTPWLDLDQVPITAEIDGHDDRLTLTSTVGNIRARVALSRGAVDEPGHIGLSRTEPTSVYGGLFQSLSSHSMSTRVALAGPVLQARHENRVDSQLRPAAGVESAFWPALTVIDYLVTMGQLAQGIVYATGENDRATVGTLWMRTMKITVDGPPASPSAFNTSTRLLRDRSIELDGRCVHDVLVESSATTGVHARSSLAYIERSER